MAEIFVTRQGPVGHIVVSNLEKFNAMTTQMWADLPARIAEFDTETGIRAIVLSGDGDKAFISGADISEFGAERSDATSQLRYGELVHNAYTAAAKSTKPVIAKIRGICMGGGLGLAAGCDMRICADTARFRMPAGRLGLGYEEAGVQRFVSLIGVQNTYDIFFSARIFDAQEALRMGFVSRVVPAEQLDAVVDELTANISDNAPLTMTALKLTVQSFLLNPSKPNTPTVHAAIHACNSSEDYAEGVKAFAQKRKPIFMGK
jgi:enoyl-CoA hydratase